MMRGLQVVLWVLLGLVSLFLGWIYLKRAVKMASEKELVEVPIVVGVHLAKEKEREPAATAA